MTGERDIQHGELQLGNDGNGASMELEFFPRQLTDEEIANRVSGGAAGEWSYENAEPLNIIYLDDYENALVIPQGTPDEEVSDEFPSYEQLGSRHFSGDGAILRALEVNGLVAVRGIEFNYGWAYARELHLFWDVPVNNPEEALAYMQMKADFAREHGNVRYINVYDFDGETIIDLFMMEVIGGVVYGSPHN